MNTNISSFCILLPPVQNTLCHTKQRHKQLNQQNSANKLPQLKLAQLLVLFYVTLMSKEQGSSGWEYPLALNAFGPKTQLFCCVTGVIFLILHTNPLPVLNISPIHAFLSICTALLYFNPPLSLIYTTGVSQLVFPFPFLLSLVSGISYG